MVFQLKDLYIPLPNGAALELFIHKNGLLMHCLAVMQLMNGRLQ